MVNERKKLQLMSEING